jgi:hypothetical protein
MSQENVEIAKRVTDAFNRRAVDALLDLATADCVMTSQLLDATADFLDVRVSNASTQCSAKAGRTFNRSLRTTATSATASSRSVAIAGVERAAEWRLTDHLARSSSFAMARSLASAFFSITARRCGRRAWPSRAQGPVSGVRPRSAMAFSRSKYTTCRLTLPSRT